MALLSRLSDVVEQPRRAGCSKFAEQMICEVAAGPLPAHHRGTRCKYVHVAPWRHPCRQGSRDGGWGRTSRDGRWARLSTSAWQTGDAVPLLFNKTTNQLSGVVSSPIAGPCGGMDAATEPTWTYLRRVPRAVRAPRPRPDSKTAKRSRDARCSCRYLIARYGQIRRTADHLHLCCRALARPPSQDTLQVRPCSSVAASMPPRVPRRWAGKDQWRWSVRMDLNQRLASWRRGVFALQQNHQPTVWCGVLTDCGTPRVPRR
ncbi:hypothetical protein FHR55_002744 [Xanthomonas arboricola]